MTSRTSIEHLALAIAAAAMAWLLVTLSRFLGNDSFHDTLGPMPIETPPTTAHTLASAYHAAWWVLRPWIAWRWACPILCWCTFVFQLFMLKHEMRETAITRRRLEALERQFKELRQRIDAQEALTSHLQRYTEATGLAKATLGDAYAMIGALGARSKALDAALLVLGSGQVEGSEAQGVVLCLEGFRSETGKWAAVIRGFVSAARVLQDVTDKYFEEMKLSWLSGSLSSRGDEDGEK